MAQKHTPSPTPRKDADTTTTTPIAGPDFKDVDDGMASSKVANADVALQYACQGDSVTLDAATNRRICRKIDTHVLPWMFFLFAIQYFDKTSLSYAAVMGVRQDLGLTTGEYAWTGSIFYLGYLVFEYPHNRLMQKFPIGRYLAVTVALWGLTLTLHAVCTNFASLMVVRFFLGGFEGSVTAGCVLLNARFYQRDEQTMRTGIWYVGNAVAGMGGGAFAFGVSAGFNEHPGITVAGWKVLFIIAGGLTCFYGAAMWFWLADSPVQAKWLSEHDRRLAVERLRVNQQGIGSRVFKAYQFREAFTDPRTWLYCLYTIAAETPAGGLTVFFTLLIQGYNFDARTTLLLSMPSAVPQIVTNLGFPYLARKFNNRMLAACLAQLLSLFAIALMTGLARDGPTAHRIGQLVGYYILFGNTPSGLIMILSSVSTNVAGYTKKTTVNAMVLISYCIGFLIGPQTFRDGPYYTNAKYNIIAMYSFALLCCMGLWWINKRENEKRDAMANELPPQPPDQEFLDLTDSENKYFRYAI